MHEEQSSFNLGQNGEGNPEDDQQRGAQAPIPANGGGQGEAVAEEWRPVYQTEGHYEVSNFGRVRSMRIRCRYSDRLRSTPRMLVWSVNPKDGYAHVRMSYPKPRQVSVGRVVLEAFVGPAPEGFEAAHQNGIRSDNRADNLKWMSPSDNCAQRKEHGTQPQGERVHFAKLNQDQVKEIRRLYAEGVRSDEIAAMFGICRRHVITLKNRKLWKHI